MSKSFKEASKEVRKAMSKPFKEIIEEIEYYSNTYIYFLVFPRGDRSKITVVDLALCVDYERDEWSNVNSNTYHTHTEAIAAARDIARRHGLTYIPFDSRYNEELNESDELL